MKSEREPGDRKATDRKSQGSTPESFDPETFVDDHVWTFAKTMPHIPHEYVVRGKAGLRRGRLGRFCDLYPDVTGTRLGGRHQAGDTWTTSTSSSAHGSSG